jgi:hypothetical protein
VHDTPAGTRDAAAADPCRVGGQSTTFNVKKN